MNNEATRFWDEIAPKLRRAKGLHPLSPEEAQAQLDAALDELLSADEIESIVGSVASSREVSSGTPMTDCVGLQTWAGTVADQARPNNHDAGEEDEDAN